MTHQSPITDESSARPHALVDAMQFAAAVTAARRGCDSGSGSHYRRMIRIAETGDTLTITGGNPDLNVSASLPARVSPGFLAIAHADDLYRLANLLTGELAIRAPTFQPIPAKWDDGTDYTEHRLVLPLTLAAGAVFDLDAEMEIYDPLGQPASFKGVIANRFSIPGALLRQMLFSVAFAMSTEETRYYLCGVHLHAVKTNNTFRLRAVATDGHRIGVWIGDLPDGAANMPAVTIPSDTVRVLLAILGKKVFPQSVAVTLGAESIQFAWPGHIVTSNLVGGTYPDYPRLFPFGNDKAAIFDAIPMLAALRKVAPASERDPLDGVKLTFANGAVTLLHRAYDKGGNPGREYTQTIPCSFTGPDGYEIGFNADYLTDLLKTDPKATWEAAFAHPSDPATFRVPGSAARYVQMPVRV